MLRAGLWQEALHAVYDADTHSIRQAWRFDENHAWYVAGDVWYRQGDYASARRAFLRALDVRPDDLDALTALANCYSELGEPDRAEQTLRNALQHDPGNADLIYNLGNALFDQGKFEQAIGEYVLVADLESEVGELAKRNIIVANERMS